MANSDLGKRIACLDADGLDLLFREARTHRVWTDRTVGDNLLHQLHELTIMAPTANNCLPARIFYIKSQAAKERLKPALSEGNVEKVMTAPVTAIVAYDLAFHNRMDELSGKVGAGAGFAANAEGAAIAAFRNGSLQGGYFMLAARALGLDVGAMSGFDNAAVDEEFFAGTEVKSNFLCNLGYGDSATLRPRGPRLTFADVSEIL